jgi:hypothetical protein
MPRNLYNGSEGSLGAFRIFRRLYEVSRSSRKD